jgi:hypothetical protein
MDTRQAGIRANHKMAEFPCDQQLHRAGVVLRPNIDKATCDVYSIFWSKYQTCGADRQDAYNRYHKKIQEPANWRSLADEIFCGNESYRGVQSDLTIDSPMALWNALVDNVMPQAFESSDKDLVHRLYAYSEWCLAQDQSRETEPGKHLPTCVTICFYEAIPSNSAALQDLPNWFSFTEAEDKFIANTYTSHYAQSIRKVFAVI